jgi:hypothetical protein
MKNLLAHALSSDRSSRGSEKARDAFPGRAQEATERVLRDVFWQSADSANRADRVKVGSVFSLANARAKRLRPLP